MQIIVKHMSNYKSWYYCNHFNNSACMCMLSPFYVFYMILETWIFFLIISLKTSIIEPWFVTPHFVLYVILDIYAFKRFIKLCFVHTCIKM